MTSTQQLLLPTHAQLRRQRDGGSGGGRSSRLIEELTQLSEDLRLAREEFLAGASDLRERTAELQLRIDALEARLDNLRTP